ncbi:hypothetical protein BDV28DRAFT_76990 [Aspergillus coremiiformis]|uniref:Uncharacterized protein n=1 Tax=Aspergillus coremiiformis TaxID=138285 RepID=A0A5N6ZBX0_9EURO|nr:hypothetical protein BDV28DRAFT_76990 [Aspergillus coremiiformis]
MMEHVYCMSHGQRLGSRCILYSDTVTFVELGTLSPGGVTRLPVTGLVSGAMAAALTTARRARSARRLRRFIVPVFIFLFGDGS